MEQPTEGLASQRRQAGTAGRPASLASRLLRQLWRFRAAYLAILPFYISFVVFNVYPLVYTVELSFHSWKGGQDWTPVGFENYARIFEDDVFRKALVNSLYYWVGLVPLLTAMALIWATILNARRVRRRGTFRSLFFLPYITSEVIIAIIFLSLLDDNFGWVNGLLHLLGLGSIPFLFSTSMSKVSVIIVMLWRNLGYYIIIMVAGLQTIDQELYEAAAIDGARPLQTFFRIVVPLMRPMILFVGVITTRMVLGMFSVPYMLTRGGPEDSSIPLTLMLFNYAFRYTRFGDASALAMVVSLLMIAIALLQFRVLHRPEGASR
jgi:ABC-type sugar transport system permease subunit